MVAALMGLYFGAVWLVFSKFGVQWTKRNTVRVCIAGFFVLLILIVGWKISAPTLSKGALVTGPVVQMRSDVSGRVVKVWITKPRDVKQGEPLFQVNPDPYRYELDRTKAAFEQAKNDVAALAKSYEAAAAQAMQAQHHVQTLDANRRAADAQAETVRNRVTEAKLILDAAGADVEKRLADQKSAVAKVEMAREAFKTNAVSRLQLTEAERQSDAADAAVDAAVANQSKSRISFEKTLPSELDTAEATAEKSRSAVVEGKDAVVAATATARKLKIQLDSTIDGEHTLIRQAREAVELAQWNFDHTTTYAPLNGFVVDPTLRIGTVIRAFDRVMSVISNEERWIIARVPQYLADFIEEGNSADLTFPLYPGTVLSGTVEKLLWATGEAQNTPSGELPSLDAMQQPKFFAVRIRLDKRSVEMPLRFGAGGTASVYTNHWKPFALIQKMVINMEAWMNYLP